MQPPVRVTVPEVWRGCQMLIGPQRRLEFESGKRLRVEALNDPWDPRPVPPENLFEFEIRPTGKPEMFAAYGRHSDSEHWLLVDGPWRIASVESTNDT